jgi:hypothetical protein
MHPKKKKTKQEKKIGKKLEKEWSKKIKKRKKITSLQRPTISNNW